jgi:hypothetical protein
MLLFDTYFHLIWSYFMVIIWTAQGWNKKVYISIYIILLRPSKGLFVFKLDINWQVQIMLTFETPILHICNNFMNKNSILQN